MITLTKPKRFQAIALRGVDNYFSKGDKLEVEKITESAYRVFGKDPQGYPWNCITTSQKVKILDVQAVATA
ncbi:hypothetical protein [Bacillus velezensis]|uniref:hypothetical protein n=1 Tax=Bacillus velezensis TaxID=492670 RepID=UPI0011A62ABB|nr:hypothetical protein [Bacillus velezensis]